MSQLNRPAKVFFAVNLAFSLGMGLYTFVMPAYARQLGASPAQFGAILSLASALSVVVVIPGGVWADRHDQRLLMIVSWGMCLPIPLIFAYAPHWTWLIPGYALLFLSYFCNPAISAYISRCASPDSLGAVWGRINSAFPLGFIAGPALGSLIIRSYGMRAVFFCTFAFFVASFGCLFLLPRDPEAAVAAAGAQAQPSGSAQPARRPAQPTRAPVVSPPPRALRAPVPAGRLAARPIWHVFLVFAVFQVIATMGQNYVSLFLQDKSGLDLGSLSWFGSAGSIGGFFLAPVLGRLRDRRGGAFALPVSLLLAAAAYGALIVLRQPALLFAALILRGGESAAFALSGPEVSSRAPRENLGRVFGSFQVLTGIGGTIGPYLGGVMYGLDNRLPFVGVVLGCVALSVAGRLVLRAPSAPAGAAAPVSRGHLPG